MPTTQGLFDSSVYNNLGTFRQSAEPLEMLACVSLVTNAVGANFQPW